MANAVYPEVLPTNPKERNGMRWGNSDTQLIVHYRAYKTGIGGRDVYQYSALCPSMTPGSQKGRKRLKQVHDNLYMATRCDGEGDFFVDVASGNYVQSPAYHIGTVESMKSFKWIDIKKASKLMANGLYGIGDTTIGELACRVFFTNPSMTQGIAINVNTDEEVTKYGLFEV